MNRPRLLPDHAVLQRDALIKGPRPTANDAQAFGVLQALAARDLRAPDDVSVTGFDDLAVATWSAPPLTTVRQPLAAMAASAFWMLTRPADSGPADAAVHPRHMELETTLVIRDSTAPPRPDGA